MDGKRISRRRIYSPASRVVQMGSFPVEAEAYGADSVGGPTICTLISAGTEINGCYLNSQGWEYPLFMGYAAVFRVEYVGENVRAFRSGDLAFCMGAHSDYQITNQSLAIRVPEGMKAEEALFARMAAVSGATLSRTGIHAGESLVVTGLGCVGIMAMQLWNGCGYRVTGTDPDADRAALAARITGLPALPRLDDAYENAFGLALECSGTQQAALECCRLLRPGGELSLVGVPWKQTGDVQSYPLLNQIFYKYLKCYTGWEFNLPMNASMAQPDSQMGNARLAMDMIADGRIKTEGLYTVYPAREGPGLYEKIYEKKEKSISVVLDWTKEEGEA